MSKYFQKHFADILLSALYIALCATAQILPDETAFVFCSEQYDNTHCLKAKDGHILKKE